jgi:hypothetical protein
VARAADVNGGGRRWKLNWYDRGHEELYDLASDPHELRNLAGDAKSHAVKAEMEARLNAWRGPMMYQTM